MRIKYQTFLIKLLFNDPIFHFRANDIDKATAAKFKVEQKQREEAKVRKDDNSVFANKVNSVLRIEFNILSFVCSISGALAKVGFTRIR